MSLGYLRPHTSCEDMTKGKLYPVIKVTDRNVKIFVNDDGDNCGVAQGINDHHYDYLPPDNGLGWMMRIKANKYGAQAGEIEVLHGGIAYDSDYWEHIPPYAEVREENKEKKYTDAANELVRPLTDKMQELLSTNEAAERDQPCAKSIGWAYAYACSLADQGIDIRKTECPAMLEQAIKDFAKTEETTCALTLANDAQERATKPIGNGKY